MEACPRCGYDRDRDEERKRLLGHIGHRLRTMLEIDAGDEGLIWVCDWCHAGEPVLGKTERAVLGPRSSGGLTGCRTGEPPSRKAHPDAPQMAEVLSGYGPVLPDLSP
jgi:hypothetical protein